MKDKIEIEDDRNLAGKLLFYWETNRNPNCVADKYRTLVKTAGTVKLCQCLVQNHRVKTCGRRSCTAS